MTDPHYLLTIAIPTYRRASFLRESLVSLSSQVGSFGNQVEVIVSDNCSPDETPQVVEEMKSSGFDIRYVRNSQNLGMDGNFIQCLRLSRGKYVWVLGDDDYLTPGALDQIIPILAKNEVGLLHLTSREVTVSSLRYFPELESFFRAVNYQITHISSNIFFRAAVNFQELLPYQGTYISLVPAYYLSSQSGRKNFILEYPVFTYGHDSLNNGGYNYFKVFVGNYLDVSHDFFQRAGLPKAFQEEMKEKLFQEHVVLFIDSLLLRKKPGKFLNDRPWQILWGRYGGNLYFYRKVFNLWWVATRDSFGGLQNGIKSTLKKYLKHR